MKKIKNFFKILSLILGIFCVIIFTLIIFVNSKLSASYRVIGGQELNLNTAIKVSATYSGESLASVSQNSEVGSSFDVDLKIFKIIPISRTNVQIVDKMYVEVLGKPFGMKIYTDGVLIVAISDVDAESGPVSPATKCGLKTGDSIISIDGKKVYTNEDVCEIIESGGGREMAVKIKRDGQEKEIKLTPELSSSTGLYKAGIWVRDSSAGIGTLTFYYPVNNTICGLGHGIYDNDTKSLLGLSSGEMVGAEIISITKGQAGKTGELSGRITTGTYADIILNSDSGVYGVCKSILSTNNLVRVALKQEVQNGDAVIVSTVLSGEPQEYKCVVKKIGDPNAKTHNLTVTVTDEKLLETTGGIIQGMSGSPILQNGKIIGAVTHVLIDDPKSGYGIYAENMLDIAQNLETNDQKGELKAAS